jgi:predicted naringenin-chalcone synthase
MIFMLKFHRIIHDFYAEVSPKGKKDMAWELSSTGFLMTLSGYVPELIEEDFEGMISRALKQSSLKQEDVESWCIHPGGRKILEAIQKSLNLDKSALQKSYDVLNDFGNMSSPTIIFVLEKYLEESREKKTLKPMVGAAFGPGLTMETFVASA